ncbi:Histidine phosphatase superfamily (branch 1) [Fibrobacter sp. UWT3]|uniref:histidine phosphatase family protein n=1 Tax=Fibrobacter sp. UWT3 TaxID=1896225 RepID=UPI000BD43274|nr:histidine phosphatase family protein [Fibrobacter sp. UWT3]SOE76783.1 Histidine phosphatase superfamily (branch 1) [Fibrobacter sp. UWT3]
MRDFVQAKDFFADLKSTERVYLLIRHAERPHITAADADYGAHVGLTAAGREHAVALGKMFPPEGDAVYYSSPVGRCMDTAKCIAEGRALAGYCGGSQVAGSPDTGCAPGASLPDITPLAVLGHLYVKDYPSYLDVLNERFYQNICSWIDSDDHPAFYPLHERAEEVRKFMLEKGTARFNIFATHDAWVVPTLVHFCKMHFTPQRWMNYLTGIAFVVNSDGFERVVPVTGMESGWLEF